MRRRREEIAKYADFFGSMDGAAKFVRGDAMAGLIITAINLVGGFDVQKVDAVIDGSSWDVPPVCSFLQAHGGVADDEMARTFNMGIGYCLIVRESFAVSIHKQLERLGERPRVIGRIETGSGQVHRRS